MPKSERLIAVLRIPGEPVGKQRHRMTFTGVTYTPQKTREKEEQIAWIAKEQGAKRTDGHVTASIDAWFKLPKSQMKNAAQLVGKPCDKRPDIDNIFKLCLDALNGICYEDDRQVIEISGHKYWDTEPHIDIVLKEVIYD